MKFNLSISTLLVVALVFAFDSSALADKLTVNLSSGSVIVVEAADQTIDWKTISRNGDISKVALKLSQVKKIDMTDRPASVQVIRVKNLLNALDSDDYQTRVNAQNELSQPSVGRRFKDLIKGELTNKSLEVRVRARQVLASFSNSSELDKPEYDHAHLIEPGKVLVGDVGEFELKCTYRGQNVTIKREHLRRITRLESEVPRMAEGPVESKLLHRHEEEFLEDPDRFIDFEEDANGDELVVSSDVSRAYESRGVIFEAEEKNFVGVNGFTLQYPRQPAGANSICPFELGRGFTRKFRGVIRVSFCEPGLPDSAAGVFEFGLFAGRIDNPRDIILEAYNKDSQMIACVESTDGLAFMGLQTNEPIAFVRVLSNPYLFELTRHIDETYVVDHVWFGEPVRLNDAKLARTGDQLNTVVLRSGDILSVEDIRFTEEGNVQVFEPQLKRRMTFLQNEIDSIGLSGRADSRRVSNTTSQLRVPDPTSDKWAVMLADRSVLTVTPGTTFQSELFDGAEIGREQVVGLWALRDQVRFPAQGDFENGENVLVFPTCRIATKVKVSAEGVSWDEEAEKIEQPVFTGPPNEDATPKFNKFEFARRTESQMPTIWFQQPELAKSNLGAIDLVDGQRIVLGTDSGFVIKSINDQMISVIGDGGLKVNLPMTQVRAVKFPK